MRGQPINPAALREARLAAGMSLQEAGTGIVSRQAFFQFERGLARPTLPVLQAIAKRLNIPTDALLARPHDPREQTMRELVEAQKLRDLEHLARQVIADTNVTRRVRAVAQYFLGLAVVDRNADEALDVLRAARGQLRQLGEPWMAAEARDWEGVALYYKEDPTAIEVGRDALAQYQALADPQPGVKARMLEHIASYLLQRHDVPDALDVYRQAIEVAGPIMDLARLANIHHGMASGFVRMGQMRRAIDYFERAVQVSRILDDVRGSTTANLARIENDFGDLLVREGRWERAEEMIQASLDHFASAGIEKGRAAALLTMGDLKRCQGLLPEAIQWTTQSIELAERLGERVRQAEGYQQLGELRAALGDRDQFEACFARAFELLEGLDLPERRARALHRYRRASERLAESSQDG